MCSHPNNLGFNGYVLNTRSVFLSGEGTSLTCNSSTRYDLIPKVDYLLCDNYGQWKPTMPRCYGTISSRDLFEERVRFSEVPFTRFG